MPINRAVKIFSLFLITVFSSVITSAQNKKSPLRKATPAPVIPYNHSTLIAPPGMVYVRGGSTTIKYDQSSTDTNSIRKVSLTSFFIDKTEITNQQYRQFTNWVIDSIAIVKYLKDDKYFIETKSKNGKETNNTTNTAIAPADTTKPVVTDMQPAVIDTTKTANITASVDTATAIKKRINWSKVNHDKIWDPKDEETRAKLLPMLDENGNVKKELVVFPYTYLKNVNGAKPNTKNTQYRTIPVNVYPDESVWAEDLTNSQTDMYVENYFKAPPFNDYPVVGVNWIQANAFSYWRSITSAPYKNMPYYMKYYSLTYTLPSEAQWVYAAQGFYDMITETESDTFAVKLPMDSLATPHTYMDSTGAIAAPTVNKQDAFDSAKQVADERAAKRKADRKYNYYVLDYLSLSHKYDSRYNSRPIANAGASDAPAIDSTPIHRDMNGMLSNFKQDEGEYWEDGSALTLPVMAFAPNEFGVYNMEGNVAEWVKDAYSPSVFAFVSDLNPVLQYDADTTDAEAMRRKVLRGGSFISNAKSLTPYYRDMELQNVSHCFVGFRCVMQAPEIITKSTSTRSRTVRGNGVKGKFSDVRMREIH